MLFKLSIPGYMEYDHTVYLLQSPDVFFVFGSGLSPYLYWLQNNAYSGTIYRWDLQQEQIADLVVDFSNSGSEGYYR